MVNQQAYLHLSSWVQVHPWLLQRTSGSCLEHVCTG